MNTLFSYEYTIFKGYNKLELTAPLRVKKGSMILINNAMYSVLISTDPITHIQQFATKFLYGTMQVETSGKAAFSDYYDCFGKLLRLNNEINYRIDFKPVIDEVYYETSLSIYQQYDSLGSFQISASFLNTNIFASSQIKVTNSE